MPPKKLDAELKHLLDWYESYHAELRKGKGGSPPKKQEKIINLLFYKISMEIDVSEGYTSIDVSEFRIL